LLTYLGTGSDRLPGPRPTFFSAGRKRLAAFPVANVKDARRVVDFAPAVLGDYRGDSS
jgi:hypothetical protein